MVEFVKAFSMTR